MTDESDLSGGAEPPPTGCEANCRKDEQHSAATGDQTQFHMRLGQHGIKRPQGPGVRGNQADGSHGFWEKLTREKAPTDAAGH